MAGNGHKVESICDGFKVIPELEPIIVSAENIAHYTLPAEVFTYNPSPEVVCCSFKNGDSERKIYLNTELQEVEQAQLRKLQEEVKAANVELFPSIARMAPRFLSRARGDIKKAITLMKDTQAWRSQYFKSGPISDKELLEDMRHGIIYFSGRDKEFRPTIVVRAGRLPEKWIKEKRTDKLIRVLVFCMEYMMRFMLIPGKVENLNVVFDFFGVTIWPSDINRLREIYNVMSHHYLGRVYRFYICKLGSGLKTLTNMATSFLTDRQKQKLCFLDDVKELHKDYALHQLEEDLGGSRPVVKEFFPFPLPGGPYTAGFQGGDNQESIGGGHVLLTADGTRGRLWDTSRTREENLQLEYAVGAFEFLKTFDLPIPPECIKLRGLQKKCAEQEDEEEEVISI